MNNPKTVVVLGKFDGVHIAHTRLISKAVSIAKEKNALSLVYSMQKSNLPSITDQTQKVNIIKNLGVDEVVFRELNNDFMMLSAEDFVKDVLKTELNAVTVVVGENFRFGKDRSAGTTELKSICAPYGIEVEIMETVHIEENTVSSTYIKKLLSVGDVQGASAYLGRPFCIYGEVSEGKHLGRKLGFPTINIYPSEDDILPQKGVYATRVLYGGTTYPAVTNVGTNPTIENGRNLKAETHILSETDISYGDEIKVEFLEFIRPEMHFANMEELQKCVEQDKQKARRYHDI